MRERSWAVSMCACSLHLPVSPRGALDSKTRVTSPLTITRSRTVCVCVCVVSVCACGWRMRVVGLTWSSSMRSWSSGGYPRSCFNPLCRYGEAGIEEEDEGDGEVED